jgi:hypothetical protein
VFDALVDEKRRRKKREAEENEGCPSSEAMISSNLA